MKKLHTRQKRKYDLSSHKSRKDMNKTRKKRAKTFHTEEAARKWAELHGFKKGAYGLVKAKKGRKFQVKKL